MTSMKKVRVFELAKSHNISNQKAIELLKKKGVSKVSAITYVDPHIIDDTVKTGAPAVAKISHLFKGPRVGAGTRPASALAATAPPPPQAKAASNVANKPNEKTKIAAKKKAEPKEKTEQKGVLPAVAVALGIVALLVSGFLYSKIQSESILLKQAGIDISKLKGTFGDIKTTVTANHAQILDMQQDVSGVSRQVKQMKRQAVVAQLKLQGAVLRSLTANLKEPLRGKTLSLAARISAF